MQTTKLLAVFLMIAGYGMNSFGAAYSAAAAAAAVDKEKAAKAGAAHAFYLSHTNAETGAVFRSGFKMGKASIGASAGTSDVETAALSVDLKCSILTKYYLSNFESGKKAALRAAHKKADIAAVTGAFATTASSSSSSGSSFTASASAVSTATLAVEEHTNEEIGRVSKIGFKMGKASVGTSAGTSNGSIEASFVDLRCAHLRSILADGFNFGRKIALKEASLAQAASAAQAAAAAASSQAAGNTPVASK
jgi:hypothetical protein